jgi:hypothetical protein
VREEGLRMESGMASDNGPFAMCIWITSGGNGWKVVENGILCLKSYLERRHFDIGGNAIRSLCGVAGLKLRTCENKELGVFLMK